MHLLPVSRRHPVIQTFESVRLRQWLLQQFGSRIVRHNVGREEFCDLLVSRRSLERCDDQSAHECGLFDPRSGDLFDIDESDLHSRA